EPEALGAALQLVQERAVVGGAGAEGVGVGGVGSEGGTMSCFGHAGQRIKGDRSGRKYPRRGPKERPGPSAGAGPGGTFGRSSRARRPSAGSRSAGRRSFRG